MFELLLTWLIIGFALGGISIATYIIRQKQHGQALVCPIGSNCDTVVTSEFSSFLGMPLEWLGVAYYFTIAVSYGAGLVFPVWNFSSGLFALSLGAFLFSAYLTFIQAFSLKAWCTWCLGSAGISTAIFITTTYVTNFAEIIGLLIQIKLIIIAVHLLGVTLGLGSAVIHDIFFFKFLKDFRISVHESETLRTISQLIWLGLGLLIISGVGLVLTDPSTYFSSAKFIAKMIVVLIIIINGAFLNLYITPLLVHISFGDKHPNIPGALHHQRSLAFAAGAVSMVSWYMAFGLGMLKSSPVSVWTFLVGYFVILVIAVAISQVVRNHIATLGHKYGQQTYNLESTKDID